MGLIAHTISSKSKTKRWPMLMFFNILAVGSVAASMMYNTMYPMEQISKADNRWEFQLNISKDLRLPQNERRRKTLRLHKQLTLPLIFFLAAIHSQYQHHFNHLP
ncbi:hypothetical protein PoB_002471800 [Plakobranchus ocellatus]|uniref:Uncharacterized protein n=1 Tax=Plakobranchus ocellatus TaxID=259542 RepID=A0AAV3ZUW0_9GAST|nr:hypothetical protein PoB_002471800 [Plakobranchus ocellatus]